MSTENVFGPCTRIVDEEGELICNAPGFTEVLIRNKFGLFSAVLCKRCTEEHRKFYARLRQEHPRNSHRRGKESRSTPSQGESNGSTSARREQYQTVVREVSSAFGRPIATEHPRQGDWTRDLSA